MHYVRFSLIPLYLCASGSPLSFPFFSSLLFSLLSLCSFSCSQSPVFLSLLCAHALCFVLRAKNHIFCVIIGCFVLMLCVLCLAVRDKKTRFFRRSARLLLLAIYSVRMLRADASCFVLCAWRAVTKNPDKHKA
jgi:hypothetical protein